MTFLPAFLGALFALLVACLVVYTYALHRLAPWATGKFEAYMKAQTEAGIDLSRLEACPFCSRPFRVAQAGRHACEEHGRCDGCQLVLDQFEAIEREQGLDSMSPLELAELRRLRKLFAMEEKRT